LAAVRAPLRPWIVSETLSLPSLTPFHTAVPHNPILWQVPVSLVGVVRCLPYSILSGDGFVPFSLFESTARVSSPFHSWLLVRRVVFPLPVACDPCLIAFRVLFFLLTFVHSLPGRMISLQKLRNGQGRRTPIPPLELFGFHMPEGASTVSFRLIEDWPPPFCQVPCPSPVAAGLKQVVLSQDLFLEESSVPPPRLAFHVFLCFRRFTSVCA